MTRRQTVTSEDMFLGMSGRTNSLADCDELVFRIELPGTATKEIESRADGGVLDVRCPRFRLKAPLPVSVDEAAGSARFDVATHTLTVVLPIAREHRV
nr:Protein pih1d3 [Polyrhizophydium stewartii]